VGVEVVKNMMDLEVVLDLSPAVAIAMQKDNVLVPFLAALPVFLAHVITVAAVVEDRPEVMMGGVVMVVVVELALPMPSQSNLLHILRAHMLAPMAVAKPITKMVGVTSVKAEGLPMLIHTTKISM
jgi:hypothetical protein